MCSNQASWNYQNFICGKDYFGSPQKVAFKAVDKLFSLLKTKIQGMIVQEVSFDFKEHLLFVD